MGLAFRPPPPPICSHIHLQFHTQDLFIHKIHDVSKTFYRPWKCNNNLKDTNLHNYIWFSLSKSHLPCHYGWQRGSNSAAKNLNMNLGFGMEGEWNIPKESTQLNNWAFSRGLIQDNYMMLFFILKICLTPHWKDSLHQKMQAKHTVFPFILNTLNNKLLKAKK